MQTLQFRGSMPNSIGSHFPPPCRILIRSSIAKARGERQGAKGTQIHKWNVCTVRWPGCRLGGEPVYALCSRERSVRTLAGARLLSNVRYEAARERYCCGRGCIEGVLRPAPNTVSHESARNAARGHLYRAFRAADTVERESPVSLDDCAHSWTSGYGHM